MHHTSCKDANVFAGCSAVFVCMTVCHVLCTFLCENENRKKLNVCVVSAQRIDYDGQTALCLPDCGQNQPCARRHSNHGSSGANGSSSSAQHL